MRKAFSNQNIYKIILETVGHIPKGRVTTYGEIARVCGLLNQARLVGYALHSLPNKSNVPWHRVINSQGKISFPRTNRTYYQQKRLLEKEGILFTKGKIDFKKYNWLKEKSLKGF